MLKSVLTVILICLGGITMSLSANTVDSLRQMLPRMHGEARLLAYQKIYQYSVQTGEYAIQLRALDDFIAELNRQNSQDLLARALVDRVVLFYNNDENDSVFKYVPLYLERLRTMKNWDKYYELWPNLINTYIFSGKYNFALREVQEMADDARQRNNTYGMGIAYYLMGNVYSNMHNMEESASSYRKGLQLLQDIKPTPITLCDLYSYYGDLLNDMKDYQQLEQLTRQWEPFLERFFNETKLNAQGQRVLESYYYMACAQAALGLNDWEKAEKMLDEVRQRSPLDMDYIGQSWLYYKSELYIRRGDFHKALELNNRRMQQLDDTDIDTSLRVKNQRATILRGLGQYREATQLLQEVIQVKDSVSGAEIRNQLNEMNTLFKVDELKMEQERAQYRNMMIIVGLIIVAMIVFTVFRIRAARRLKKAHDQLLVAYDQLEETTTAKERIESDLRIARNIQMGMVPHTFPQRDDIDLYALMTPAKEVGGDLYGYYLAEGNTEQQTHDRLYFCLGDVSGKGVPASLFMAQATRLFRTLAAQEMMPAEIANHINEALSGEDNETGMFVTMFIGLVDLQTGHLNFCNAGHNPPVILTLQDGSRVTSAEFIEMEPNFPIGIMPGMEFEGEEIADISNKPFFVYTDGLNEAENRQQEQFSDERLLDILQNTPFQSSEQTIEMLREVVETHRDGADPNDDLTMLCIRVKKCKN